MTASMSVDRYCTHCGALLSRKWLATELRERDVCAVCHHVTYDNPKVLVAGIVYWRDEIILCRRAMDPAKGRWCVPMGYLEKGETLEEAISRELHEETQLEIPPHLMELYAICSLPLIGQVHVVYRTRLLSAPALVANKESFEVRLFSEPAIPMAEVAFADLLQEPFKQFFHQLRRGRFEV